MQNRLGNLTRRGFFGLVGVAALSVYGSEKQAKQEELFLPYVDPALEEYYNEAMSKFQQEETKADGLKMLLEADKKFPNSALAHFLAGNAVYYNLEIDLKERHVWALERYDKALSLDSKFAGAYVNRGTVHYQKVEPSIEEAQEMFRTGNFELPAFRKAAYREALADLEKAIKLRPSFSAFFNRGRVKMHSNQELEAVRDFQQAIKIGSKNNSWEGYLPKIQEEAVTESLVGSNPLFLVSAFAKYILDNHCDKVKGHRVAVQDTASMIYLQNENDFEAFANFQIGTCYARQNVRDYDNAVKHYSKAIELNPNVPAFYQFLGMVQFGTGKRLEAAESLEKYKAVCEYIAKIGRSWRE